MKIKAQGLFRKASIEANALLAKMIGQSRATRDFSGWPDRRQREFGRDLVLNSLQAGDTEQIAQQKGLNYLKGHLKWVGV